MEVQKSVTPEGSQKKEVRTRQRHSTSCRECRRRKQKCNQARNTACNNCARRYPPVPCVYDSFKVLSKYKESIIDLTVIQTTSEDPEPGGAGLSPIPELRTPQDHILQHTSPQSQGSSTPTRSTGSPHAASRSATPDRYGFLDEDTSDQEVVPVIQHGQQLSFPRHPELGLTSHGVMWRSLDFLPIASSGRNDRLFHFFIQRLSPFISSIDGNVPHGAFTSQWLSFMIQSPVAAHVAIVSAAHFQAVMRHVDVDKSVDAVSAKGDLIVRINEHIRGHSNGISDDSIAAVMLLALNESIYSDQKSTMAHMRGLRDMIRTRGGINNIHFGLLRKMILRTDYQIACTYECDLLLDISDQRGSSLALASFPLELDNPVLHSPIPFVGIILVQNIDIETAKILDCARSLTTSALALAEDSIFPPLKEEILSDIHYIHHRLTSSPPANPNSPEDFLYQACRMTAIIYSSAIITKLPLSMACTPEILQDLSVAIWRVPLQRWKTIPGIFLWIMLVIGPFSRDKPTGRFYKALTQASITAMNLVDEDTAVFTLRRFFAVQSWLGVDLRDVVLTVGRPFTSKMPERGLPALTTSEKSFSMDLDNLYDSNS
ncbi:hypothetical protein VTL71DRAFT_13324 [Oculimacula yallundae]|uniref:Zn(2)-C6 fungal-type domain-containing protein n=1 Tax=Oculimacula yallundae TaxID=86028 RepID=A0ABR4CM37_9HELO